MSSPKVQTYAESAAASGAGGLGSLVAAGAAGRHPQNLQRALTNAFGLPKGTPDFLWARIPTTMGNIFHPFVMPHLLFQALLYFCQPFGPPT